MHCNSIKDIYNGLLNKYQFDLSCMQENETPEGTRYFMTHKHREHMTNSLHALSYFAHDLGEPELAGRILSAATELGTDAVPPMPL